MMLIEDRERVIEIINEMDEEDLRINEAKGKDPEEVFNSRDMETYVIEDEGKEIGICGINSLDDVAQTPMFFFKDFRKQGFGTQLIDTLEDVCRDRGYKFCLHRIRASNFPMLNLSTSKGYKPYEDTEAPDFDFITMMKEL